MPKNLSQSLIDEELPEPTEDLETSLVKSELLRASLNGPNATDPIGNTSNKVSPVSHISSVIQDQHAASTQQQH